MKIKEKASFLQKNIDDQIQSFKIRRKDNRRKALLFKISTSLFATSTTVLLGLSTFNTNPYLKDVALVLSAMATLLTIWDKFFDHRALWVRYTYTLTELYAIKSDLEYILLNENLEEQQIDRLHHRYQQTLKETNSSWQELRKDSDHLQLAKRLES